MATRLMQVAFGIFVILCLATAFFETDSHREGEVRAYAAGAFSQSWYGEFLARLVAATKDPAVR